MSDVSWLSRSALLVGNDGIEKLQNKHVLVIGLGGVGSFAAEFICRSGIGEMTIVDGDVVDPTNRNRQLPALATNHGVSKAEIMQERLLAINPELKLNVVNTFLSPEKCREILESRFDYIMDCIDSVMPKITLLSTALEKNIPIVSSMGAGGKMDPTRLRIAMLPDTYQCVFASYVRKRLNKLMNASKIKAVFSTEEMDKNSMIMTDGSNFKRSAYGTVSYLPAAFGGACASVVIRDLLGLKIEMAERPARISHKTLAKKKIKKS
ncbi:tRNA A37 threonylcarbamoyladenosine dehydratase [Pedobacter psychrotolerans]|uniref:tRNA A37 threonylcarbamoyladenosine dehydratase n=1 Tax=Pedobacter psychrotolerans TaxID=1843235 RepID=A0A4R2H2P9_9SPHI|nr:tRNA threonylcarbamoyladenosine dehydratase [Pedobacter psychrotolerans]TCO19289.1 tRNA A37 threonylcarbamoyladenosine dehydratase [Pedobacter psychrotolerans]GGE69793.1 tRNA threonylcarbamoyladenosine dehydratase [Pedobacter psychrotolerans]